ncbi:MAG: histidine kinase [Deltaproteobacteria bacterium]|nr:histidine kinase [Deltaproteobacteria bacterium]
MLPSSKDNRPLRVKLRQSLREQAWWHLVIAGMLTFAFNDVPSYWLHLLASFGASLLISVCIGTATTTMYMLIWDRLTASTTGTLVRALYHGVSVVLGVLIGTEVAVQLLRLTLLTGVEVQAARAGIWRVGLAITVVVMIISMAYDRLREQARTHELREQQAQQALLRAQIDNLQAKVNPHFLFNALNTVASLAEEDAERAVEAIERLSALLRYSLEGARQGRVPLREELDAVRSYLALEELRFGDRLRARVEADPTVTSVLVPPFLLQPLVENAVKHGIAPRREGGEITVQVQATGSTITLIVQDDGPGHSDAPGTQTGHENLRQRLALVYGSEARFEAGPVAEGGYRVCTVIPRDSGARDPAAASASAHHEAASP